MWATPRKLQERIPQSIERSSPEAREEIKAPQRTPTKTFSSPIFEDNDDEAGWARESDDDSKSEQTSKSESESDSESDSESEPESEEAPEKQAEMREESEAESEAESDTPKPTPNPDSDSDSESDTESDSEDPGVSLEEALTQKSLAKTEPSVTHSSTQSKFYYLSHQCEHSEHLTSKYVVPADNPPSNLTVVLYLYTLCDHTYIPPFIVSLLEYNESQSMYDFPQFTYDTSTTDEDTHKQILDKALEKIYDIFKVKAAPETDPELFQKLALCYKGLLSMDESNIILCIDVSPYLSHFQQEEIYLSKLFTDGYTWAVLDEIMHRHQTQQKAINSVYANYMFSDSHDFLTHVRNEDGKQINTPKLLWNGVYNEDGKFETMVSSDQDSILLLAHASTHPKLGDMYFFSQDPVLETTPDYSQLHRYVVFVDDPIVFKGKEESWNLEKIEVATPEEAPQESIMDAFESPTESSSNTKTDSQKSIQKVNHIYSCIQFEENSHTIYGVKSSNFYCIL